MKNNCFHLPKTENRNIRFFDTDLFGSGLPKVIFLAVAEAEGEGGKTSALEVEAEGEAEGLVFCI